MTMTTAAQSASNRINATKSTGPRTSEGRAVAAANSLKHGLRSGAAVLPSESREEWEFLLDGLRKEWLPVGITEDLLVERMAAAEWKRRRSEVFEQGGLVINADASDDGPAMALIRDCHKGQTVALTIRYRRAADAAFYQAKHELERQQARRNLPQGATMPPPLAIDVNVTGAEPDPEE